MTMNLTPISPIGHLFSTYQLLLGEEVLSVKNYRLGFLNTFKILDR